MGGVRIRPSREEQSFDQGRCLPQALSGLGLLGCGASRRGILRPSYRKNEPAW